MAGLGVFKLDTGESFPTNCFPIRSIFHQSKEGAGHWVVAHRTCMDDKMPELTKHAGSSTRTESEHPNRSTQKAARNTLDGKQLMDLHCVERPSDLCSVDISERNLESVKLEDWEEFDSVAYVNASDNHLTLESFSRLHALRELELSLNGLGTLDVHAEQFPRLEVLDLSYNNLSAEAILAVGLLPSLKVLHLTGNNLHNLPANMAGPYSPPDESLDHSGSLFQTLKVLMLDDNKLSSPEVFTCLAELKRLQYLNLEGNDISEVPYLQPLPPVKASSMTKVVTTTQHIFPREDDNDVDSEHLCPPFPQLQCLNLASNKILAEESLLAVALFPQLSELIIHSNPLTTQRSGDPPLLALFLQDRFGIRITRKKPAETKMKPHFVLPVNPKRKIQNVIPKVPKVPLITASQFTSDHLGTNTGNGNSDILLPSTRQPRSEKEISEDPDQTEETFFVTEVNNLFETTEMIEETNQQENVKQCPPKLRGYEILLDDNPDLNSTEPLGIQQSVKILEQTLKNLLVYRDSIAKLDHQKPCRENNKRIKKLQPSLQPRNPREEKMIEVLAEIKEVKAISIFPLAEVLQNKDINLRDSEEVLTLLKDFKRNYRTVHLKAMEHASHIELLSPLTKQN